MQPVLRPSSGPAAAAGARRATQALACRWSVYSFGLASGAYLAMSLAPVPRPPGAPECAQRDPGLMRAGWGPASGARYACSPGLGRGATAHHKAQAMQPGFARAPLAVPSEGGGGLTRCSPAPGPPRVVECPPLAAAPPCPLPRAAMPSRPAPSCTPVMLPPSIAAAASTAAPAPSLPGPRKASRGAAASAAGPTGGVGGGAAASRS